MSGLQAITYQTVVNQVIQWIQSNCTNITNYSGMSGAVKNGYSYQAGHVTAGDKYWETVTATLSSPIGGAVNASTVSTDMNSFLSSVGASSYLNTNISDANLLIFLNDIVSFCCTKCCFIAGQANNANNSSARYLVYYTGNTTYNNKKNFVTNNNGLVISASDVNSLLSNIVTLATQNMRILKGTYSYSFTHQ